jgi:hypothetical protein
MPRRDGAWQEVACVPAATHAPDPLGRVWCRGAPSPPEPHRAGQDAWSLWSRAGDALPLPGGAAGVHQPRPDRRADPVMTPLLSMHPALEENERCKGAG